MTTGRINLVSIVQAAGGWGEARRRGTTHVVPLPRVPQSQAAYWAAAHRPLLLGRRGAGRAEAPLRGSRGSFFKDKAVSSVDVVLLQKTLVRRQVGPTRRARAPALCYKGGARAASRGGRALPEASLESVLGGEGRGAQPQSTRKRRGLGSRLAACAAPSVQSCGTGPAKRGRARVSARDALALLGPHRLLRVGGCGLGERRALVPRG